MSKTQTRIYKQVAWLRKNLASYAKHLPPGWNNKRGVVKFKIIFAVTTAFNTAIHKNYGDTKKIIKLIITLNRVCPDETTLLKHLVQQKHHRHNPNYVPSNEVIRQFCGSSEHSNYVAKVAARIKDTFRWITTPGRWRRFNMQRTNVWHYLTNVSHLKKQHYRVFNAHHQNQTYETNAPPPDKYLEAVYDTLLAH